MEEKGKKWTNQGLSQIDIHKERGGGEDSHRQISYNEVLLLQNFLSKGGILSVSLLCGFEKLGKKEL